MNISKITLGTAQLGMKYGIANNKIPDFQTSIRILKYAWDKGINSFDTAPVYGNSELIIGSFISSEQIKKNNDFLITTKLPKIEINNTSISYDTIYNLIKERIFKSLSNLNIKKISFYLLHNPSDILLENGIIVKCLNQFKNEGLIEKFGISAYNPEEVKASLEFREIDVIQVPINIFDHRLINTGLLKKLEERKYTIFARSIYLQGLFFLPIEKLPNNLELARAPLIKLRNFTKNFKINITELAMLFVRDLPGITSLVIGAEDIKQINKNLKILKKNKLSENIINEIFDVFDNVPEKIINPSLWNK